MLKPLELTVYPLDPAFPRGYNLPRDTRTTYRAADRMAKEKRLTGPELAADYWLAMSGLLYGHGKVARKQRDTLRRFATLPHYDEEVTP